MLMEVEQNNKVNVRKSCLVPSAGFYAGGKSHTGNESRHASQNMPMIDPFFTAFKGSNGEFKPSNSIDGGNASWIMARSW